MIVNLISEVVRRQGGREAFKIDSSRVTRDSEVGRRDADIWGLMLALYRIFFRIAGREFKKLASKDRDAPGPTTTSALLSWAVRLHSPLSLFVFEHCACSLVFLFSQSATLCRAGLEEHRGGYETTVRARPGS